MDVSFREFNSHEIDVGLDYAEKKDGIRLMRATLKIVANHAGAIRINQGVTPRVAAVQALRAYEKSHRTDIDYDRYEAYIHAFAKMASERNPHTRRKRRLERDLADIKAAAA